MNAAVGAIRNSAAAALWCAAAVLLYWPAMHGEFVFDDVAIYFVENLLLRRPDGLWKFWFSTEPYDYLPLSYTLFWIEYRLFGLETTGYHVVSAVLHGLTAMATANAARRLGVPFATAVGAVFLVHPVCVESVAWASQQKTLLAGLFAMLATSAFVRAESEGRARLRWLSLLYYVLSLLAKPAALALPAFFVLWLWRRDGRVNLRAVRGVWPWLAAGFALALIGMWFQQVRSIAETHLREGGVLDRLLTSAAAYWFYFGKAVLPFNLTFVYPRWEMSANSALSWVPLLALLLAFAGWFVWRRRDPKSAHVFGLAAAWFGLLLLPSVGVVDVGYFRFTFVADHYQYLALPAVPAAFACALAGMRVPAVALRVVFGAIVCCFAVGAMRHAAEYRTAEGLWRATLARNPKAALAHASLGRLFMQVNDFDRALRHFQEAQRLQPEREEFMGDVGVVLAIQGKPEEAEREFRHWVARQPRNNQALRFLGVIVGRLGRLEEAVDLLRRANAVESQRIHGEVDAASTLDELARVYLRAGRLAEARTEIDRATALAPNHPFAWEGSGKIHLAAGDPQAAETAFRKALETFPNHAGAALELAKLRDAAGDAPAAAQLLERVWGGSAEAGLALAFLRATSPDDSVRRPADALARLQNVRPAGMYEAAVWDCLAVAHAAAGDFAAAQKAGESAVEACRRHPQMERRDVQSALQRLERRLELYRQGKPFRGRLSEAVETLPYGQAA